MALAMTPTMDGIRITSFPNDDQAVGCITPEDNSWQLVVDHEGLPHLILAVKVGHEDGRVTDGWLAIDDVLAEGVTIKSLVTGVFADEPTEEELEGLDKLP